MLRKHLQVGVIKGAIGQDVADARFEEWKSSKTDRNVSAADSLSTKKDAEKQAKLDAERKVNESRAEAIAKKNAPVVVEEEVAAEEVSDEAAADETTAEDTNEAPAAE
jgi:small subunit ribosomal protein S16